MMTSCPGTPVGIVTASDDEGDVLTYRITSNTADSASFMINSSSGELSVSRRIDREVSIAWGSQARQHGATVESCAVVSGSHRTARWIFLADISYGNLQALISDILRFMVSVSDASETATINVAITVVDINDNSPIFDNLPRNLSINEVCPFPACISCMLFLLCSSLFSHRIPMWGLQSIKHEHGMLTCLGMGTFSIP